MWCRRVVRDCGQEATEQSTWMRIIPTTRRHGYRGEIETPDVNRDQGPPIQLYNPTS
jgi:hypothetical protein